MSYEQDAGEMRVDAWATAQWGNDGLGLFNAPTVKLTPTLEPKTVPRYGSSPLGETLTGWKMEIVLPILELTKERLRNLMPWYSAQHGYEALPQTGTDLYDYAKALVLHPLSGGDGTDLDLYMPKAVPTGSLDYAKDGKGHSFLPVIFSVYLDRESLPREVFLYLGRPPT